MFNSARRKLQLQPGPFPRKHLDLTAAVRLLRRNGQSQSAVTRPFGVSRQTVWRPEQPEWRPGPPARWYHCESCGTLT